MWDLILQKEMPVLNYHNTAGILLEMKDGSIQILLASATLYLSIDDFSTAVWICKDELI